MKKVMAVYDTDPFYAERFADFINRREKIPMAVMAFTSMERLKKYGETHDIEILLVSSQADKKAVEDIKAAQVVVLSDGSPNREKRNIRRFTNTSLQIRSSGR